MLRVHRKVTLLGSGLAIFIFNSVNCSADITTIQNGLQITNTYQHPGDYYYDQSMPTPNPDIFPPPPPKSSYLPTQPFSPTLTGQLRITKDEANKALNGYRNPSLPTPNPDIFPPPPVVTPAVNTQTTTTTTTTTTQSNTAATSTATATAAPVATEQPSAGAPQPSGNSIQDLKNCVPGTYTLNGQSRPITTPTAYNASLNTSTPTMTYTVTGMQNGKCSLSITQNAQVPPTIQNGALVPTNTTTPMANVANCNLSPSDLANMVGQVQKTQTNGYYGTTPMGSNYYTKQGVINSCSSFLAVGGAAIPYNNVQFNNYNH